VQATVRTFDPASHSGTVLLDDGVELPYGAQAFDGARLWSLRIGQRVRVRLDESGLAVSALTLSTFA
jgi:2-phospho-L-lactate guanylyltransferase